MTIMVDSTGRPLFRHEESSATVPAAAESVFAFLDTHENIAAHMNRPNWAMLGGRMTTSLDDLAGKEVGSVIRIEGRVLGITISLAEKLFAACRRVVKAGKPLTFRG